MVTSTLIYQDVAAWLRIQIGSRFPVGQPLPSEAKLLQMYNQEPNRTSSRSTFRKGLQILKTEGIIQSGQGIGTFVLSRSSVPEERTTQEGTLPPESRLLATAPATHQESPRMHSPHALRRPSDEATTHKGVFLLTSSLGTSDRMEVLDLGNRLQLEFVAANRFDVPNHTIVLTKFPASLVNAMKGVLDAKRDIVIDFTGQNFKGRVCVHVIEEDLAYSFVAEFFATDKPIGYLIHLERDELVGLCDRFLDLPVSPHPTD